MTLSKALTLREGPHFFKRGQPIEVTESEYHRLCLTGRLLDPDRSFESIPPLTLKKLRSGTIVTVVRSMGLGDVLMLLPVIRALARDFPDLLFRYCTGTAYAPLLKGLDFLHDVKPIIEMRGRIDNCIEMRGLSERHELRKSLDRIDIFARYACVKVRDYSIPIVVTDAEREMGRALIGGTEPTIALAVRGSTGVRSWIDTHVREFSLLAAENGWRVVVLDGEPQEFPEHPRIQNLTGRLNLTKVKAVIAESDFCVAPDTGLVHLSEAVGTKCLALFSSQPPALRIFHYRHVKALWRRDLTCTPCWDRGCPPLTCVRSISPEIVLEALHSWDSLKIETNPKAFAMVSASPA